MPAATRASAATARDCDPPEGGELVSSPLRLLVREPQSNPLIVRAQMIVDDDSVAALLKRLEALLKFRSGQRVIIGECQAALNKMKEGRTVAGGGAGPIKADDKKKIQAMETKVGAPTHLPTHSPTHSPTHPPAHSPARWLLALAQRPGALTNATARLRADYRGAQPSDWR